jgi:hypothetical protein
MLSMIRNIHPTADPAPNNGSGVTDVRLYRINFANEVKALHIKKGAMVSPVRHRVRRPAQR